MRANFSRTIVDLNLITRDIKEEEVYVADEAGLQGTFEQAIGQVLGAVCGAQNVDIRFGDFKSVGLNYRYTPDVAMVTRGHPVALRALGELKVPWVKAHDLHKQCANMEGVRLAIGQVVEYMIDQRFPYGFYSTYEKTIFLRHIQINGSWRVEYSYIVDNNDATDDVSVKKCFWHLARLAASGQPVNNSCPKNQLFHHH